MSPCWVFMSSETTENATANVHTAQASQEAARGGYPTDSSTLFLCTLSHSTTLQHQRLPSVTTDGTARSGSGTSENSVRAKFREHLFYAVG
jgi:hypothetical protein